MKTATWLPAVLGLILVASADGGQSNAPVVLRQASFGGSANDVPFQLRATPDGGLLVGGASASTNGTRTSLAMGGKDFWLVKQNSSGAVSWDRSYGGSAEDELFALQLVKTNQWLLAGGSSSPPAGNKTSPNYGLRDFWVVLTDANGEKIWDRSFGGTGDDFATCAAETEDGGFVVAGYSQSASGGNKNAPSRGMGDFWLVRLDANGNKLWDQSYGGAGDDCAFSLVAVPGGSLLLAGNSDSAPGGNKRSPNYGYYDLWLLKLDSGGDVVWEKDYGGDSDDGYYQVALARTAQGELLLGAESFSGATGNKLSPNLGSEDFWVLRLDASGNRLWETNCGGADSDYLTSLLVRSDGTCVAAGGSNSGVSGNKSTPNRGSTDFWLVGLDAQGKRLWDKTLGGTGTDALLSLAIAQAADGTLICCGDSSSGISADKTAPLLGGSDYWVLSLGEGTAATAPSLEISLQGGQPRVVLRGEPGKTYVTEASANLQSWIPVATNLLNGTTAVVSDPGQAGASRRSYRARLQN